MLGNRKLVLDTWCEVYDLLKPWCDGEFWQFDTHEIIPGAIYLIGREQYNLNSDRIRYLVETDHIRVVLSNPSEGSDTMRSHCQYVHKNTDLVLSGKILIIGGGDMDPEWPCLQYDSFLPKILDYVENHGAIARSDQIFVKSLKPFKFLFLNGRHRQHRLYLLDRWKNNQLLTQCLWTNLDRLSGDIKCLPAEYEVEKYRADTETFEDMSYVKSKLFNQEWGEIYLQDTPYIDTYFSVVTETVHDYPWSFRTEKIWKPMAMAHPWIAVANQGYYRDLHNLGFRSFAHLLDETFDAIENNSTRLARVACVVEDLCRQDLPAFLDAAQETCGYNQQHLADMSTKVRQKFPKRFSQFIKKYKFDE